MKTLKILLIFSLFFFSSQIFALENLFYTDNVLSATSINNSKILDIIKQHSDQITILAPQIYQVDKRGLISGSIDDTVISIAKQSNLRIMPLITNSGFSQSVMHELLTNAQAKQAFIQNLIRLCQHYHFYGIQFDFENINYLDRDILTKFVSDVSEALHKNQIKLSMAIVPPSTQTVPINAYAQYVYENWSGAYDINKLSQSLDFITIMAYDLHTSLTTPGPIAPVNWVKNIIENILKTVPAEKISLGIPAYSGYWFTEKSRDHYQPREHQIGFDAVSNLIDKFKLEPVWQEETQTAYVMFSNPYTNLNEYLFIENEKAFTAKLALAKQYHLRGISVWKLGMEHPKIWDSLPTRTDKVD